MNYIASSQPAPGRAPRKKGSPVDADLSNYGPTVTVDDVAVIMGVSRSNAYEAIRTGIIPSIRFGRRIIVPKTALERLLSGGPQ